MLQRVRTSPLPLSTYDAYVHRAMTAQIEALAEPLRGLRVVHINATPDGGGVAEILRCWIKTAPAKPRPA